MSDDATAFRDAVGVIVGVEAGCIVVKLNDGKLVHCRSVKRLHRPLGFLQTPVGKCARVRYSNRNRRPLIQEVLDDEVLVVSDTTKEMKMKKTNQAAKTGVKKATSGKSDADWREAMLERIRAVMKGADSEIVEEIKWRKPSNGMKGVPVWSRGGIICTGETYKDKVKMTFAQGAALKDPAKLFNAGLDGGTRRAIDFKEGDKINEKALKALIQEAVAFNTEEE